MAERSVCIVTDDAADLLPYEVLEKDFGVRHRISTIPLFVQFGMNSYETGENFTNEQFKYLIETTGLIPKTSVPSEEKFFNVYQDLVTRQGFDVVSVHVGSLLSGTYGIAERVAREFGGRVGVIDSGTVSMAQGLVAIEAEKMAAEGMTKDQIMAKIPSVIKRVSERAIIPNLDFVKESGRITILESYLGKALSLIGIAQIDNNISKPIAREMGNTLLMRWMVKHAVEGGIPERVVLLDFEAREFSEKLKERMIIKGNIPAERINLGNLGQVTGSHGGPGTVGVSVLRCPVIRYDEAA